MKLVSRRAVGALALLLAAGLSCDRAATVDLPPQVGAGQAPPMAHPYDAASDAHTAVDAALEQARASNKRVLIDFGANWCPDCRMLAGVLRLDPVQSWIAQEFVPVSVNVDHFNVNSTWISRGATA
jgi:thiol:disulfide interchange protein